MTVVRPPEKPPPPRPLKLRPLELELEGMVAVILAITGVAMSPLPVEVVAATLGGAIVFAFLMDFVKFPVFRRLGIC